MLTQLSIKNFTLIASLSIDFESGFSVITGETGAGKSIILGAIGLLLGQRADSKSVKAGADRCVIEAHFKLEANELEPFFQENDIDYDPDDTIIRRELSAAGKSRAFINDSPAPLALLKELGEQLVDIHSQHQNLLVGKHDFQLGVVDIIAKNAVERAAYAQSFSQYQQLAHRIAQLQDEMEKAREKRDFLQFQYDELNDAHLSADEQGELEQRSELMTHAEDIKGALYEAQNALDGEDGGVVNGLKTALSAVQSAARVVGDMGQLAERLESSYIDMKDVAEDIAARLEGIDFNPAELDEVNRRLDTIYDLQKKHKASTVAELIAIAHTLADTLSKIDNSDETLADMQSQLNALHSQCRKQAEALTRGRKAAATTIEQDIRQRLVPLGMPHVRFAIDLQPVELNSTGGDRITFLFSANTSTPLQPVAQVASGGETARVMLALKAMISGAIKLPTIIFDEIDTGVSGKIAEQMALMMQQMGDANRQVVSITHLPQIAAAGKCHYKVYKEEAEGGTTTFMRRLNNNERVAEIAQMMSGAVMTDAAIENAKQLLSFSE